MEETGRIVYKIGIVGPEASGKTSLAEKLSNHFSEPFTPEFAREYLENQDGSYVQSELDFIAGQQLLLEEKAVSKAKKMLFCDTTPLVVKVWSNYKYGNCSRSILDTVDKSSYDLYLLLSPDIEYQDDPLRENPSIKDRLELFKIYEQELLNAQKKYFIVEGFGDDRFKNALRILNSNFSF